MIYLIFITSRLSTDVEITATEIFVTGNSENTTVRWFRNPRLTLTRFVTRNQNVWHIGGQPQPWRRRVTAPWHDVIAKLIHARHRFQQAQSTTRCIFGVYAEVQYNNTSVLCLFKENKMAITCIIFYQLTLIFRSSKRPSTVWNRHNTTF